MDTVFDICYLGTDGSGADPEDIPLTKESVWVLGREYSPIQGRTGFSL